VHKGLKARGPAGDRADAIGEYRAAMGLCQADHDPECAAEATRLTKAGYR
jgi:hypothetical protein